MPTDRDYIILKSGLKIYVHGGIIGLAEKETDNEWRPSYGWDGGFPEPKYSKYYDPKFDTEAPSKEDMLELADIMIARWQEFKKYVASQ